MKHIKLVLSISILLYSNALKSQSFFIDGATYYTYTDAISLTPGYSYASYFKEIIKLDSINQNGEYYTIKRSNIEKVNKIDSSTYKLKVRNDRVYFSGYLINHIKDSFLIEDLMIYDFTQKPGDTLNISDSKSGLKQSLILDSIISRIFEDGISRQVFYYTVNRLSSEQVWVRIKFVAKGLGSDVGLVGFRITNRISVYWEELISICSSIPVYSNTKFSILKNNAFCEEDSIIQLIKILKKASFNVLGIEKYKIYPNPVKDELWVSINSPTKQLTVEIVDFTGKVIGKAINPLITNNQIKIDLSRYYKGFYTLVLHSDTGLFNQKFIKLD